LLRDGIKLIAAAETAKRDCLVKAVTRVAVLDAPRARYGHLVIKAEGV
jgi:hypothetical protein